MRKQVAVAARIVPFGFFILTLGTAAHAVDGTIEINQARALVGGVTPGDAAGFPVELGASGHYVLTGNLTLPDANTTGVQITANDVTLDLNGFAISGPSVAGAGHGVNVAIGGPGGNGLNTTIRNGSIRGVGDRGINAVNPPVIIQDVRVADSGGIGIQICFVTSGCIIENSTVTGSGSSGIVIAGPAGVVRGSTSTFNGGNGIQVSNGGLVVNSSARSNTGNGISVASHSNVIGNVSRDNTLDGIRVGDGARVDGNTVANNGEDGIDTTLGDGCSVTGNTVFGNDDGLFLSADTSIGRNTVSNSTTSNIAGGPGVVIACNAIGGIATCP